MLWGIVYVFVSFCLFSFFVLYMCKRLFVLFLFWVFVFMISVSYLLFLLFGLCFLFCFQLVNKTQFPCNLVFLGFNVGYKAFQCCFCSCLYVVLFVFFNEIGMFYVCVCV